MINWPLPLLEKGVMLVDSPGANVYDDPIIHKYILKADAVIYLMNAISPYTNADRQELTNINDFCRSIFLVVTYFDLVRADVREELMGIIRDKCRKRTTLGPEEIHFVASLDALAAKQQGNSRLLIASGYDVLEKYLADYLAKDKGRSQIEAATSGLLHINRQMAVSNGKQIVTASIDKSVLPEKIQNVQRLLELYPKKGEQLRWYFENEIADLPSLAERLTRDLCNNLPDLVSLEDFVPETALPTGLDRLNPSVMRTKRSAKSVPGTSWPLWADIFGNGRLTRFIQPSGAA